MTRSNNARKHNISQSAIKYQRSKNTSTINFKMTTDLFNDRLAIKNLIFTKSLPNHTIPFPTDGYKIFPCIDCGDKFIFETSYQYHTNRKSLKIIYFCRCCNVIKVFYNRCQFLSHIRSHAFRTATINVTDIKLDPLPIEDFNMSILNPATENQTSETQTGQDLNYCYECNEVISTRKTLIYKSRAEHYMKNEKKTYSCPLCQFLLPTLCALEAHLRIHLRIPPYFCPECGLFLPTRSISYPFNHQCEGFKMMKATAKLHCFFTNCKAIFNSNALKHHIKTHFSKVYKCSFCLATSNTKQNAKCDQCKNPNGNIITYFRCPICINQLFFDHNIEKHLDFHCDDMAMKQAYPCTRCNTICENMCNLLKHCVEVHKISCLQNLLKKVLEKVNSGKRECGRPRKPAHHQAIKKRCNKCLRTFTYRSEFDNIKTFPKDCPYKCSVNQSGENEQPTKNMHIQCYLCKRKISEKWPIIKAHFATFHKSHKCLDLKVMMTKIDNSSAIIKKRKHLGPIKKSVSKVNSDKVVLNKESSNENKESPQYSITCNICNYICENKEILESHMVEHRDPCMAYQCLECGQCFVVKPSFSTHLLLEHGISDVQEYIDKKPCYNELAMLKNQNPSYVPSDEPVQENQCRVCREQFDNETELQKHFRVHGMAFLMKYTEK